MFFCNAEGRGVGPCHGSQAVMMSKVQVLSLPARLSCLPLVHGSDMMMFHSQFCNELKYLSCSLAGQDNSYSETSQRANKETQGPVMNPSEEEMNRLWVRSFDDPDMRGERERRVQRFKRRHGDRSHWGQQAYEWLQKDDVREYDGEVPNWPEQTVSQATARSLSVRGGRQDVVAANLAQLWYTPGTASSSSARPRERSRSLR